MAEIKNACSGGSYGNRYNIVLEYFEGTPNTSGNYSPTTINVYIEPSSSVYSFYGSSITGRVYVNGSLYRENTSQPDTRNGRVLIASWTGNIPHEENGDKSISISAELIGPGGYAPTYGSVSTYWTLTKIYRGSVLGNIPNFIMDYTEMAGVEFSVPTTRYVSSYTDKLTIKIGSDVVATRNNFVSGKITFTSDELLSIYSKMSSNSAAFTFVLQTFNGNTQIGSGSTKNAIGTLSEKDRAPIFNDFDWVDGNETTMNLTLDTEAAIQGQSKIQVHVFNDQLATGRKGANIVKYIMTIGSQTVETSDIDNYAGLAIENADNPIITVYAVDNRGNSTSVSKSILKFIPYVSISGNGLSCKRSENGVGKEVDLSISGTFSNIDFGVKNNSIKSILYKYRVAGTEEWIDGTTVIAATITNNNYSINKSISGDLGANGFSQDESFEIYIEIHDELTYISDTFTLPAGSPAIAMFGNCVALGAPYNESLGGRVQINGQRATSLVFCKKLDEDTSMIDIQGLDLEADGGIYDVMITSNCDDVNPQFIRYTVNNIATNNYTCIQHQQHDTTVNCYTKRNENSGLFGVAANKYHIASVTLNTIVLAEYTSGVKALNVYSNSDFYGETLVRYILNSMFYNTTVLNVNSIQLKCEKGNFKKGTLIKIWRRGQ